MRDAHSRQCQECREHWRKASDLAEMRLGARERRVLLEAQAFAELGDGSRIVPCGPSSSDYASTRRAVAKLRSRGLIEISDQRDRVTVNHPDLEAVLITLNREYAVFRRASRTQLGEAVVSVFGSELKNGGAIRWGVNLDTLREEASRLCPER